MSKYVYKYTLNVTDKQTLILPFKAQILCVQVQNNIPVLYAKVDLSHSLVEKRYFHTFGTGHLIKSMVDNYLNYVGTYQVK